MLRIGLTDSGKSNYLKELSIVTTQYVHMQSECMQKLYKVMQTPCNLANANDGTLDVLQLVDQWEILEMVIVMLLIYVHQDVFQWQWMQVKNEKMKKIDANDARCTIDNFMLFYDDAYSISSEFLIVQGVSFY